MPRRRPAESTPDLPEQVAPMMATLREEPFDDPAYMFEIKWDGTRAIALRDRNLRIHNRRFNNLLRPFPELDACAALPPGTVVDGEVVVLEEGKPSFTALMRRQNLHDEQRIESARRRSPATFMIFDLLYVAGRSIMDESLERRRSRLAQVLARAGCDCAVLSDGIIGEGRRYFAGVTSAGLEGMVAKRLRSPYVPGKRTDDWLKVKVARTDEFELIGMVPRDGDRAVAALLIGMVYRGRLIYKGRVGSGLTESQRREMFDRLVRLPALADPPSGGPRGAVWKETGMRCKVRYFEKTVTGMLRGPVLLQVL